jgi:hypothetical protein
MNQPPLATMNSKNDMFSDEHLKEFFQRRTFKNDMFSDEHLKEFLQRRIRNPAKNLEFGRLG